MFMERDEPGFRPEFLPLTFLTKILLDVEDRGIYSENASFVSTSETSLLNSQAKLCVYCVCTVCGCLMVCLFGAAALNPFEEQENVDARFVEETALKQTLILMGFQDK